MQVQVVHVRRLQAGLRQRATHGGRGTGASHNVLQSARKVEIVAIDPLELKREKAMELGATTKDIIGSRAAWMTC